MTEKFPINRWGYVTSFSLNQDFIEAPHPSIYDEFIQMARLGTLEMTVSAPATQEIVNAAMRWAKNQNARIPIWTEEWLCLYCGSPQPLPLTHCSRCGAPRNWILG